jgi:hypothetical protein
MVKQAAETRPKLNNRSRPFLKRKRTFWGFKLDPERSQQLAAAIRRSGLSITDYLVRAACAAAGISPAAGSPGPRPQEPPAGVPSPDASGPSSSPGDTVPPA